LSRTAKSGVEGDLGNLHRMRTLIVQDRKTRILTVERQDEVGSGEKNSVQVLVSDHALSCVEDECSLFFRKQASENVLRTSMGLGGNAPFPVFDDADLDKAITGALAAKFQTMGQACTATIRFIIHSAVAAEFESSLAANVAQMRIGRGTEDGVAIRPLINE
jgi:hypothetical protein